MKFLKVGDDKYINPESITHVHTKRQDRVLILFRGELTAGGIGIPPSFLELKGSEAEAFIRWLDNNSEALY